MPYVFEFQTKVKEIIFCGLRCFLFFFIVSFFFRNLSNGFVRFYICNKFYDSGADPALLIRGGGDGWGGGPNSEIFLSDLRELFQRVQLFVVSKIS